MSVSAQAPDLRVWISHHLDPLADQDPVEGWIDPDQPFVLERAPTPAAVLVGLIERPEGYTVLLTRRADTLRSHTGQVALPGGRRDPGETPWATALREAHEEIGLAPDHVELAGLSTPYRTATGYHVTPVVGFVAPDAPFAANPAEVAEVFEAPFAFLMDPRNHEELEREWPSGVKRRFYGMTWNQRFIWGATAGILRALHDRLYGAAVA